MTTVNEQVGAWNDDCIVHYNGSSWLINTESAIARAGYNSATSYKAGGGHRFQSVAVPQGATISSAYITLTCQNGNGSTTVNAVITGEDTDDAAAFSNLADYQSRRGTVVGGANDNNITSAQVAWNNISSWVTDIEYSSPDIKTIIQEIVNRPGWTSGNDMVLFVDDHADTSTHTDGNVRVWYNYDLSTTKSAKLVIEYTEGGSLIPKAMHIYRQMRG
jgi:hypothetical protein